MGTMIFNKTDDNGYAVVKEAFIPDGVDNTNNVYATASKPTTGTAYAWTPYVSQALDSGEVIKASAGKLRKISAIIGTAAASDEYFLQVFDAAAQPANGAVTFLVPPRSVNHTSGVSSVVEWEIPEPGINFLAGLTVCISTTQGTKTIAGDVAFFTAYYM